MGGSGGFGGTGALVIEGAGTVALDPQAVTSGSGGALVSVANTFMGGVTVQSGTLELGASSAAGSGAVTMSAGTTLSFSANALTIANAISISGDPTFYIATGQSETLSGVVSNASLSSPGALDKTGGGTPTLTNDNTYSGGTDVYEGKLAIGNAGALGGSGVLRSNKPGTWRATSRER